MADRGTKIDDDLDEDILDLDYKDPDKKPESKAVTGPSAAELSLRAELDRERALRIQAEERHGAAQKTSAETRYASVTQGLEATKASRARLVADQKAALEAADYDRAAKITDELADIAAEARELAREKAAADRKVSEGRVLDKKEPATSGDPFEDWIANMPQSTKDYLRSHKDDVVQPHRNKRLIGADTIAQSEGLQPGTKEYFAAIDRHMGYVKDEPADEGDDDPEEREQPKRRAAAPPSREGSSTAGNARTVRLTAEEREMAQHLGMTTENYAKQKMKLASKAYKESRSITR